MPAVGKADGRAGVYRASGKKRSAARQIIGQNADAGRVVAQRQRDARLQLIGGQRGVEQRVVDHLGNGQVVV